MWIHIYKISSLPLISVCVCAGNLITHTMMKEKFCIRVWMPPPDLMWTLPKITEPSFFAHNKYQYHAGQREFKTTIPAKNSNLKKSFSIPIIKWDVPASGQPPKSRISSGSGRSIAIYDPFPMTLLIQIIIGGPKSRTITWFTLL